MSHQEIIEVSTAGHGDMQDLTGAANAAVERSSVRAGVAHLFVVGSTACLGTIEFEEGLAADLPDALDRLIPPGRNYGHEQAWHDGNGHSHLQSTLVGPDISVPVSAGRLALGTWQQIFLMECDVKPRRRRVVITVLG